MSGIISRSPNMNSGKLGMFPSGHVLQTATGTITAYHSTTSTSYVDTGLTCNFVTKNANSKVFCSCYWIGQSSATSTHVGGEWQIDRNGTEITHPGTDGFYLNDGSRSDEQWNIAIYCNFQVLDSPAAAAGTTLTYKLQSAARASAPSLRTGHNGSDSFITIFEIEA